jgi:hypothetical protein
MKKKRKKSKKQKLKEKVVEMFSKYIRLKYAKNGYVRCYTCGKVKYWKKMQCGHGFGGRGNSILFDEEICRPQCYSCNVGKGGNYDIFHAKLEEEYGFGFLQRKLRQKNEIKQFTELELENLYSYYKEQINQLNNS